MTDAEITSELGVLYAWYSNNPIQPSNLSNQYQLRLINCLTAYINGDSTTIDDLVVTNSATIGTTLSVTGATTLSGGVAVTGSIAGTSTATTTAANTLTTSALTTGQSLKIVAAAATLTTGRYISLNDGSTEVFGVGANGHLHSTVSAAPPTIAVTTPNGISAAAITVGGTDTCGVITTTGTNNNSGNTVLDVTFGKTYTTAPKFVGLFPVNSAAAKASAVNLLSAQVTATSATGFTITIPQDAGALATPSWRYFVIQ